MPLVVRLAGITFGSVDGDGDRFKVTDIVGWTGVPAEVILVEKPTAAGAVVALARTRSRVLSLVGYGIAATPTPAGLWRVRNKLEAAVAGIITADGTLEVDEPTGTTTLTVRLTGDLRVRERGPRVIEFDVPLVAPNPTKA